jgi:hypothetical protein
VPNPITQKIDTEINWSTLWTAASDVHFTHAEPIEDESELNQAP